MFLGFEAWLGCFYASTAHSYSTHQLLEPASYD